MKIIKNAILKIENDIVYLNKDLIKKRKISSRAVPTLLGYNQWQSVGKGVLDRLGLLEYEKIDAYYTVAGEIAEYLADDFLHSQYREYGVKIETKRFQSSFKGSNGIWYGNNLYKSNPKFSGVNDIGISSPDFARANVEVKSKSMKSYEYIINRNQIPAEELLQGEVLSTLAKSEKLIMLYVFYPEVVENMIREYVPEIEDINEYDISYILKQVRVYIADIKIVPINYKVDFEKTQNAMEQAHQVVEKYAISGELPIDLFSVDDKQYFFEFGLMSDEETTYDDLPF